MTQTSEAILYENRIGPHPETGATAIVTASSEAAGFEAQRLLDPVVARTWRTAASTSSAWILFDFGAQVSMRAFFLRGGNLTDNATRRIRVSTADSTGAAGDALDTGTGSAGLDERWGTVGYIHTADVTGRYLRWDIADSDLSYLEVGRPVAGPLRFPARGIVVPFAAGFEAEVRRGRAAGGAQHVAPKWQGRRWRLALLPTADERDGWVSEMLDRNGRHADVLVVKNVLSSNLGRDALWGLIAAGETPEIVTGDQLVDGLTLTVEERL